MGFEMRPNSPPETRPTNPTNIPDRHPADHPDSEAYTSPSTSMDEHWKRSRYREQVCGLKEQIRVLKEIIVGGHSNTEDLHNQPLSPDSLQQQVPDRGNLAEATLESNTYLIRAQALEDRLAGLLSFGPPDAPKEVAKRMASRESRELDKLKNTGQNHFPLPVKVAEDCEQQLILARSQRDSAIRQNDEARRNLATAKAERNGAHQRLRILEEEAKQSVLREGQLRRELAQGRERCQADIPATKQEQKSCGKGEEQEEIRRLRDDLDFVAAEKSMAQVERDAARIEIRGLEKEVANAHSAAEAADEETLELRRALDAVNNAALAERKRADEARRTQNKLRVDRETCRIEVNQLRSELASTHKISRGVVRNSSIAHVWEERDVALRNVARLQDALKKANETVDLLQRQLDECLARRRCEPADDSNAEEANRIIAERDAALAHVKELERLLKELEEDYRKNLDQWEQQTQSDEREISTSKNSLKDERKKTKDLAAQLKAANIRSQAARTNAQKAEASVQAAEHRANAAETQMLALETQTRQMQRDLDEANNTLASNKEIRDRLRAEILRLGGIVIAARAEVLRLGGTTIDPDGTVQPEGNWPDGPPLPNPPASMPSPPSPGAALTSHPPVAYAQPIPEDPEDYTNPFSYPPMTSGIRHHDLHRGRVTAKHDVPPLQSPPRKSSSTSETIKNEHDDLLKDSPPPDPLDSPFPSPITRLPGQPPIPPVYTSPTMSTRTSPRITRNPAPNYRGPGQGGERKRKPKSESGISGDGPRKRAKGPGE